MGHVSILFSSLYSSIEVKGGKEGFHPLFIEQLLKIREATEKYNSPFPSSFHRALVN
jgi:hypothetical protein